MVVGIIGILAAVAIPAYNNYTNRASRGVTESALLAASRQVNLNRSTGDVTTKDNLDASITSKGQGLSFVVNDSVTTPTGTIPANSVAWCIAVDIDGSGATGNKYQSGCINQGGDIKFQTPTTITCSKYGGAGKQSSCEANFCTFDTSDDSCASATGVCALAGTCS